MRAGKGAAYWPAPRTRRAGWTLAVAFLLACGGSGRSQSQTSANGGSNGNQDAVGQALKREHMGIVPDDSAPDPVMQERRFRALNIERQRRMVADANKLFALAKELNDEVASTNTGSFTLDQLHKIAEIEKLARSVKERMAVGVGDSPGLAPLSNSDFPAHP